MTTVRIAHAEPRPGRLGNGEFQTRGHLVVLADDAGHRAVPIWLRGEPGAGDLSQLVELANRPAGEIIAVDPPEELTARLLRAAGARVTGVDIDELGPGVTAARIGLASPAGTRRVTARLGDGLAIAGTAGAPIRVSDAVMGWLAVPAGTSSPGPLPAGTVGVLHLGDRPRYEPRNTRFADGLDGWLLGGSFAEHASESHWHDYTCAAEHGTAVLSSAVPQPEGFAFLAQEMFADDYLGAVTVFRGQFRTEGTAVAAAASRAGLFLRVRRGRDIGSGRDIRGPLTEEAVLADPSNHIVTITGSRDWTRREVTARVPDDCTAVVFGVFLAGPGRIELRDAELTRTT
jgi:bifunctional DNase/RNase